MVIISTSPYSETSMRLMSNSLMLLESSMLTSETHFESFRPGDCISWCFFRMACLYLLGKWGESDNYLCMLSMFFIFKFIRFTCVYSWSKMPRFMFSGFPMRIGHRQNLDIFGRPRYHNSYTVMIFSSFLKIFKKLLSGAFLLTKPHVKKLDLLVIVLYLELGS